MKTWANLACFSFGIWGWKSIGLERQIQPSYFKISAHTRIHTPVSQNEVGVGGRKTKRPSKSGLPRVTCLQTSACRLPSLSEPMHTHTHGLDFSSSAWHRDLNTNILWEEMSWCWLLDSQICSPFSDFSKDSRSGKGPPRVGMRLEAGNLEAGPSSATDSLCDHRSTIYPHGDGFYNRERKSDILYWEEIPARTPRFTQFYKILVEQLLWDAQKPWIWADAPFSWEVHHWESGRYQSMLHLHSQVYH